ncbi:hypothetical protein DJ71_06545 [Halorubrum sp. E3]|nr:hypothetical protein DJ71_06545 [Halorubrum sp. E3]
MLTLRAAPLQTVAVPPAPLAIAVVVLGSLLVAVVIVTVGYSLRAARRRRRRTPLRAELRSELLDRLYGRDEPGWSEWVGELSAAERDEIESLLDVYLRELDGRDADRRDLAEEIDGYERTAKAFESPIRAVAAGDADAGLGLRETADRLGCGFVSLGEQSVVVRAASDRLDREPVAALAAELGGGTDDGAETAGAGADAAEDRPDLDAILADLPGYSRNSRNDP